MNADLSNLKARVLRCYLEINGLHEMTNEDDRYVSSYFSTLEDVARHHGVSPDDLRRRMLAGSMPMPSYIRSDGAEMIFADAIVVAESQAEKDQLKGWFVSHWADEDVAEEEWQSYLSGQNVCLRSVTPQNMKRKSELVEAIKLRLASPAPEIAQWVEALHKDVDELDLLELPFTGYDVLRFGGPSSRERLITYSRNTFPRPSGTWSLGNTLALVIGKALVRQKTEPCV